VKNDRLKAVGALLPILDIQFPNMTSATENTKQADRSSTPWIVIPTYDEKENVASMIHQLFGLGIQNLSVLIVDDNSPDGTGDIVSNLKDKYPNLKLLKRSAKTGLGKAYIAGFNFVLDQGATHIVQMDCDFSHDPQAIPELISHLDDYDLVLGSRYVGGISVINWPLSRLILSMGANFYTSIITGLPYKDTTGGYRVWQAQALRDINLSTIKAEGYGFQIATLYRAWKKSKKIIEIPIVFTERRNGQSKMSKAIVFESVWLVWKIRFFDTNK